MQPQNLGLSVPTAVAVPDYLRQVYWWAYVHPRAVRIFERQWLVNLILWGNFARLRDTALDSLGERLHGRTLQVACVYGDFTTRLAARVPPGSVLEVVDVLPVQLDNLRRKLAASGLDAKLHQRHAADLGLSTASFDRVAIFFLLHEIPEDVRRRTLGEALRVLKPGGRLVIVDYHRPVPAHPLRGLMRWILRRFEPFALDLWAHPIDEWLPPAAKVVERRTSYGGLYQQLVITR